MQTLTVDFANWVALTPRWQGEAKVIQLFRAVRRRRACSVRQGYHALPMRRSHHPRRWPLRPPAGRPSAIHSMPRSVAQTIARSIAPVLMPLLALPLPGRCLADQGADHTTGIWMVAQASGSLGEPASSRWRFAIDAQARYFDLGSGVSQWLIRPAVGYTIGANTRVWGGFGRFRVRNREGASIYENRPWQQIDWQQPGVAGGRLLFRLRLEQRNLEGADDIRWALRFLADYQRPVSLLGADRLVLAVEPFFDLHRSDWGGGSGISQHRLVAGLSWPLRSGLAVEAGYMNQYFHAEEGLDRSNHLAVLRLRMRY